MRRAPGTGSVYRPGYKPPTGKRKKSRLYWLAYRTPAGPVWEPAKTANRQDAETLLRTRLSALDRGEAPAGRATWNDLAAMIRADYKANGRRSAVRLGQSLAHLDRAFGGRRAATIAHDQVTAYVAARLEAGAARATVNRELAAFKRAFRLGARAGRVAAVPFVQLLREDNTRAGFFERADFERVLAHLPAPERLVCLVAYTTGWRVRSEILTRQWQHLDLKAGWLRLEPGEAKNREGRMFPLTPALRGALRAQRKTTTALEREAGKLISWVFHRDGEPIRYFRRAWLSACKAAGVPGKIPHDFRRTAVRNLERAGVSRSAAMALVGHKTEAIYRRYAIVSEADLRDAVAKLGKVRG